MKLYINKAYENSDNGNCPKYCSECTINKECLECHPNYSIYIGNREGDVNPIICSNEPPTGPYYKIINSSKTDYFRCIEYCLECTSANKCDICELEYIIDQNKCITDCINHYISIQPKPSQCKECN